MAHQELTAGLRRFGIIVLDSDLSLEPELSALFGGEIGIHVTRVRYPGAVTSEALSVAHDALPGVAQALEVTHPELIVYACTSGSFFAGSQGNAAIETDIMKATGRRCVTASSAVVHSLRRLAARRVGLVSPYSSDMTRRLEAFLAQAAFEVPRTFELFGGKVVDDVTLQSVAYRTLADACLAVREDVDVILVSCTGVRMLRYIEALESTCRVPVISSNAAIARLLLDQSELRRPASSGVLLSLAPAPVS